VTRLRRTTLVIAVAATALLLVVDFTNGARAAQLKKPTPVPDSVDTSAPKPAPEPATDAAAAPQSAKIPPSFPKTVDQAKAETEAAKKPAEKWSNADIADAKAHCAVVLHRIHAIAIPHEPIKEGACGAPAPVELVSIGQNPEVALSPPAIVRCDLAETLVNWLENDLQPLARKRLKSEIIKIETMSSYDCRNAYGRKTTHLSEHGLANAVDIGGFVTASAKTASVLDDWGTPQREILANIAAEKAETEKRMAEQAAADNSAQANLASGKGSTKVAPMAATATMLGAPAAGIARSTIIEGVPKLTVTLPGAMAQTNSAAVSIASLDRLGGPTPHLLNARAQKFSDKTLVAMHTNDGAEHDTPERVFLHEAHAAACRIFGTTLGPEANADHRNHFHVDMAPRTVTKICD
jgi:hypothetical protein